MIFLSKPIHSDLSNGGASLSENGLPPDLMERVAPHNRDFRRGFMHSGLSDRGGSQPENGLPPDLPEIP